VSLQNKENESGGTHKIPYLKMKGNNLPSKCITLKSTFENGGKYTRVEHGIEAHSRRYYLKIERGALPLKKRERGTLKWKDTRDLIEFSTVYAHMGCTTLK